MIKKDSTQNFTDTDYHVPNLDRALSVFELLNQFTDGLNISECADKLKIPRNSAHRILMTLYNREYLTRDEDSKKFYLTKKLLIIGYGALSERNLVEYALGPMRELRNETMETVPLGVLNNGNGVVIEQVSGLHLFKYVLEPGKLFHLHTAAPAKAIIAFLPETESNSLLKKMQFQKFNDRTINNIEDYRKVLSEIKYKGYSVDYGEEHEGMHCVGAPVFDQHGYPVAAIWITGPSGRINAGNFDNYGKKVKKHALKISQKLGYGINEQLKTQNF